MSEVADRWRAFLAEHDEAPPLDVACARLAAEEGSGATVAGVQEALDALAADIDGYDPHTRLARLLQRLFVDEGLHGDEESYDHPVNSCIDAVIARRRGLPLLLSILTCEVGRRAGVPLDVIGFPGHVLVATTRDPRVFLDPFRKGDRRSIEDLQRELGLRLGRTPDPAELSEALRPTPPRDLLVRMCNNLVASWTRRGNLVAALRNAERRVGIRPDVPELRRERGLLHARLGSLPRAADDLQHYLAHRPAAPDAGTVALQLSLVLQQMPRRGRG